MPRYRPDTPAARLRDAPTRARRLRRAAIGGYILVCLLAFFGVAVTAPGPSIAPGDGTPARDPRTETRTQGTAPDGRVEVTDWTPLPLPEGWSAVRTLLVDAVAEAEESGLDLTMCVQAVDARTEPIVCAGSGTTHYAASVTKLPAAVAALEAWGGDPDAETPLGVTVGEVVDQAITVSDNDAADQLAQLAATGPDALDPDPFTAINATTARVGLEEEFHAGSYYTESYWSWDWSHLDAAGAARYLTELVRAADDRQTQDSPPLTEPKIARHILDAMVRQERTGKIPRELPARSTANKTGETDEVSHDVAVVNTSAGRMVMTATSTAYGIGGGPDQVVGDTAAEVVTTLGGAAPF